MTHLSHKIPWHIFDDIHQSNNINEKFMKRLKHFTKKYETTLNEFAQTHINVLNSSKEKINRYKIYDIESLMENHSFTDEEIKGVLAHEVSHLLHKDLRFILLVQGICDLVIIILSSIVFALAMSRRSDEEESFGSQIIRFIFAYVLYIIVTIILRIIALLIVC